MTQESSGQNIPLHTGIIMDGNGRWAKQQNLSRSQGHVEGLKTAKRIVKAAAEIGIKYLTLYVFSTENWKRTSEEVGFLMGLIQKNLLAEFDFYRENRIRIRHAGNPEGLPRDITKCLEEVIHDTAIYDNLTVTLAINYGGRDEIVRSVCRALRNGYTQDNLIEQVISSHLDNNDIPEPDLIIRTASELRTSNFLLWQAAYAEYYFSSKLWPDWNKDDLLAAIADYSRRDRRFGGIVK